MALLQQAFTDYGNMLRQRQDIDFELAQKEQFIRATFNMLPEGERSSWEALLGAMSAGDVGLAESIRNLLRIAPRRFYTATEVKKLLVESGFDFSKYTANPLPSVHAALKRLKPDEAEMSQIDGVMVWRWLMPLPSKPLNQNVRKFLSDLQGKHFMPTHINAAFYADVDSLYPKPQPQPLQQRRKTTAELQAERRRRRLKLAIAALERLKTKPKED